MSDERDPMDVATYANAIRVRIDHARAETEPTAADGSQEGELVRAFAEAPVIDPARVNAEEHAAWMLPTEAEAARMARVVESVRRKHSLPSLVSGEAAGDLAAEVAELRRENAELARRWQGMRIVRIERDDANRCAPALAEGVCQVTGGSCDPSYAYTAPILARRLDEVREALGLTLDTEWEDVLDALRATVEETPR